MARLMFPSAAIALLLLATSLAKADEGYTTNSVCRKKFCVNPVFPGVDDLHLLRQKRWICEDLVVEAPSLSFCRGVINYNAAIPSPPGGKAASVASIIKEQERSAITMYAYHLNGMGLEALEHTHPEESDDDCIKAAWRLTCYTYFPKCDQVAKKGEETEYLAPCQSSCKNYLRTCGVECCDESVQCVFEHKKYVNNSKVLTQGYSPHDGPSAVCTGAAFKGQLPSLLALLLAVALGFRPSTPSSSGLRKLLLIAVLALVATNLQGCDVDVPEHSVGNWRAENNYLVSYQYIPPGASAKDALLNSCSLERLAQTLQCNGRGVCRPWDPNNLNNPVMFCDCDRDWADPECRTERKSQASAYMYSIFMGPFGADLFYLGYPILGAAKLCTLGGFGLWWILDIVRIGSAPVYAHDFRVAQDLPHWAFVISSVLLALTVGFVVVGVATLKHIRRHRKDQLLLMAEEEATA